MRLYSFYYGKFVCLLYTVICLRTGGVNQESSYISFCLWTLSFFNYLRTKLKKKGKIFRLTLPADSHEWRTRHLQHFPCFPPAAAPSHSASTRPQSWGTPTYPCRPRRPSGTPSSHSGCCRSPFPEGHRTFSSTPQFSFFHVSFGRHHPTSWWCV